MSPPPPRSRILQKVTPGAQLARWPNTPLHPDALLARHNLVASCPECGVLSYVEEEEEEEDERGTLHRTVDCDQHGQIPLNEAWSLDTLFADDAGGAVHWTEERQGLLFSPAWLAQPQLACGVCLETVLPGWGACGLHRVTWPLDSIPDGSYSGRARWVALCRGCLEAQAALRALAGRT